MDVDLDMKPDFDVREYFDVVRASKVDKGILKKHPVGVYFQNMATDDMTGFASIPYKEAEDLGYLKVDFLSLHLLSYFQTNHQVRVLAATEPNWDMLENSSLVENMFHIGKHFKLINRVKPRCIEEMADCLALLRPAKRYLLDSYIINKDVARKSLYTKSAGYYFKKSHAIAYATTIVLQMHLINHGIEKNVVE